MAITNATTTGNAKTDEWVLKTFAGQKSGVKRFVKVDRQGGEWFQRVRIQNHSGKISITGSESDCPLATAISEGTVSESQAAKLLRYQV